MCRHHRAARSVARATAGLSSRPSGRRGDVFGTKNHPSCHQPPTPPCHSRLFGRPMNYFIPVVSLRHGRGSNCVRNNVWGHQTAAAAGAAAARAGELPPRTAGRGQGRTAAGVRSSPAAGAAWLDATPGVADAPASPRPASSTPLQTGRRTAGRGHGRAAAGCRSDPTAGAVRLDAAKPHNGAPRLVAGHLDAAGVTGRAGSPRPARHGARKRTSQRTAAPTNRTSDIDK